MRSAVLRQINFASSSTQQPSIPSTTLVIPHASRIWNAIGTKLLESMVQIVLNVFRVGIRGTVGSPRKVSVLDVPIAAYNHSTVTRIRFALECRCHCREGPCQSGGRFHAVGWNLVEGFRWCLRCRKERERGRGRGWLIQSKNEDTESHRLKRKRSCSFVPER